MKPLPQGKVAFARMWQAHPHNYQGDEDEDTSSEELRQRYGLPGYIENTCAVRMSIMLNATGETITPARARAAGLARRPHYQRKRYYLLSAKEMWTYLTWLWGKPVQVVPRRGRFTQESEFTAAWLAEVEPRLQRGARGLVAFDKIFTYAGTGHVDLFDGEHLSDAPAWYPCQRLLLWFVTPPT
ncbi:MAG: T6SS effector amidase Tae4 family protein [Kofleriaceae bacterium]